ncbi:MAG: hypothetical protein GY937_18310 [bacterium]|nr:hypothetical protein [bacterium]
MKRLDFELAEAEFDLIERAHRAEEASRSRKLPRGLFFDILARRLLAATEPSVVRPVGGPAQGQRRILYWVRVQPQQERRINQALRCIADATGQHRRAQQLAILCTLHPADGTRLGTQTKPQHPDRASN